MAIKTTNSISEKIWGKKAIHIPNTTDIYGADLVSSFVDKYVTRTLCLLAKEHKIILPKKTQDEVEKMVSYFNKIGFDYISMDNFIFLHNEHYRFSTIVMNYADQIPEFSNPEYTDLVPFTSATAVELLGIKYKKNYGLSEALSQFLNDKSFLRQMLHDKDILVPSVNIISTVSDEDYVKKALKIYRKYENKGIYECAVIMPRACSGYGIHRFQSERELREILKLMRRVEIFMIDPWLDNLGSPAFQVSIADKKENDICLGLSDQMLDGQTHLGNKYKSEFSDEPAVMQMCDEVTEILRDMGVRGIVGVDLLIREIDGEIVPYVLEVNARQTGAIYAGFLAYELRNGEHKPWVGHNNVVVPINSTIDDYHEYLKSNGIDYTYGDNEGVIITCIGNLELNHKVMILAIADTDERLKEILDIATSFE
ncbi:MULTISPECIES: ATP-grasp domain-containing protein [unclassified Francisella]|uniref:ATP-grasp domain-containing protein n=1 Tax=unclassified Francisella TaxID=2610885 RepID=UPI002E33A7A0|nr:MULTISPECIES: ATP-grasp domain-containing protein [unclassified Francisella]MED7819895.1 ATP-grasp domain-containing protein [Francisella sp. 19S2-4]MED7830729.1 ATP-grasp domain-containing protein [Francisella sp. 19S2-10]